MDLRIGMPDAWPRFFHKRRLTLIQNTAIPQILAGKNVLISSPTASGKTEAMVAPLYQRHVSFRRSKLSVIFVAPTRALVNDIYFRVSDYLGGIGSVGGVYRYTGDHHEFSNPDQSFMLVTTPEALDSLQLTKGHLLNGVRAIVVDEIHLLHGQPRGQRLRQVIRRVRASKKGQFSDKDNFQTIGSTATLQDPDNVKALWLGDESVYATASGKRDIEMTYAEISCDVSEQECAFVASAVKQQMKTSEASKALIFANSRDQAHRTALALKQELADVNCPVFLHIGILSASERDRIEDAMKTGKNGLCVATSTLEVGIDIGDIEMVFLLSPPKTVSSFLQRIGRGNRQSSLCKVVALCRNPFERSVYEAIASLAKNGELDETYEYTRHSVYFQQVLSFAWIGTSKW